jgi:hypothetical protein
MQLTIDSNQENKPDGSCLMNCLVRCDFEVQIIYNQLLNRAKHVERLPNYTIDFRLAC